MAQAMRLLVTLVSLGLAAGFWFALSGGWFGLLLAAAISIGGGNVVRRLATPDDIRAALEDRIRNPPN